MKRIHLNQTDSTNTYIKELMAAETDLPEFTLVDAEFQTGGRGQTGNSWESEAGQNITFSLLCHPTFVKASEQFILSEAIALAVQQTLSEYTDGITVKWPNDIYRGDKKICGTLIECNIMGMMVKDCIIGTGININQKEFNSDAINPISLFQITGHVFDRTEILDKVIKNFTGLYKHISKGKSKDVVCEYKRKLYRHEGFFLYKEPDGEPFEAEIVDVESSGYIVLKTRKGEVKKYEFKQVRFVLE